MTIKLPSITCKLPTMTTYQRWCYMTHLVAYHDYLSTQCSYKVGYHDLKLLRITYEIAFDEKLLKQLLCHGEATFVLQ